MSDGSTGVVVVYVTAPLAEAPPLARALVEQRLAACVSVVPEVRSVYRWEGAVHEDTEALLLIKTTADGLPALLAGVRRLHTYSTPEIIALPVVAGDPAYLAWVVSGVGA
jgi:periplasmic divalent cation tolerance protein